MSVNFTEVANYHLIFSDFRYVALSLLSGCPMNTHSSIKPNHQLTLLRRYDEDACSHVFFSYSPCPLISLKQQELRSEQSLFLIQYGISLPYSDANRISCGHISARRHDTVRSSATASLCPLYFCPSQSMSAGLSVIYFSAWFLSHL